MPMLRLFRVIRRILLGPPHRSTLDIAFDSVRSTMDKINGLERNAQSSQDYTPPPDTIDMTNITLKRRL